MRAVEDLAVGRPLSVCLLWWVVGKVLFLRFTLLWQLPATGTGLKWDSLSDQGLKCLGQEKVTKEYVETCSVGQIEFGSAGAVRGGGQPSESGGHGKGGGGATGQGEGLIAGGQRWRMDMAGTASSTGSPHSWWAPAGTALQTSPEGCPCQGASRRGCRRWEAEAAARSRWGPGGLGRPGRGAGGGTSSVPTLTS
ncbi:hypothetical protein Cadr_000030205 [Camelus dromedarius]|uniref:Uncharacterized protein n=1 Tax=Camelus dromedarius TaxID=9838 RepID=A0A5N4C020_CAMDR|nr:hypothetical protein Cadr_000030205 [Camelus dromedarius]